MIRSYFDFNCGQTQELRKQLAEIIKNANLRIVFQPIVSLRDGSVFGYEALCRGPAGSPLENPDALFGIAAESGRLWELEQLSRTKALEAAFNNNLPKKLFLNVNPAVIHDEKFKNGFTREYLLEYNIDPSNIYFEISEKNAVEDLSGFISTIEHYKNQNYKIAIDDAGAGYSGLNMITDVHPHFIKLDMKLIRDIDKDAYKKALVKSLHDFSCLTEIALIAEGIETEAELRTLIDIGVHFGQGYFIQYPNSELSSIESRVLETIHSGNAQKNHQYRKLSSFYIRNLCCGGVVVSPDDLAGSVYNCFLADDNLLGVTVVNAGLEVLGTVSRLHMEHAMSGQYGFSLYAKRPISQIMDTSPLTAEASTPIDTVSKLAMSRPRKTLYDLIVVTEQDVYTGVVTIKDLLEKTMEIEVFNSRHLNPLSGLPGNLSIEQAFEKCIASGEPYSILYIDLDNFKAYNDVYGFGNGDRVIKLVAQLLVERMPGSSFIGHVGGDDFIVILRSFSVEEMISNFLERFDSEIRSFYSDQDLQKGFIVAKNRKGEEEQFPIMSISVACVNNKYKTHQTIGDLTEYAASLKKKCKQIWKSCYLVG